MIVSTVNNILGKNDFDTEHIKVVFDSKKVTDHHAIIPTVSSLSEDLSGIPESEAKVYGLISNKLKFQNLHFQLIFHFLNYQLNLELLRVYTHSP